MKAGNATQEVLNDETQFQYDVEGLMAKDKAHSMHPWHEFGRQDHMILADSEGIYVYDGAGNRYIDGIGGMWAVQLGYGNEEMAKAISDQVRSMVYYSPWSMATPPHAELSAKLATLTPGDLNRFFYSTGGSTANDSAIRFVHYYWNVMGEPSRKTILTRADAYHGSTYLADSLCGKPGNDTRMEVITEWISHLSSPNPYRKPEGMSDDAFRDHLIAEMETRINEIGPENVAAFIAEPVLASGGVIVPPKGYQKACLEMCRKYGILYVCDEVVTGFGRMGHFFSSEPVFDIVPDIITAAKGFTSGYIPAGLTAISEKLHQDVIDRSSESPTFSMGFTYSGHPVAMARRAQEHRDHGTRRHHGSCPQHGRLFPGAPAVPGRSPPGRRRSRCRAHGLRRMRREQDHQEALRRKFERRQEDRREVPGIRSHRAADVAPVRLLATDHHQPCPGR